MVGNGEENILVEFDYNNITVIDPNKVIDENGKAKERFVKQENLVIYANLECRVLPRTKLAVGVSNSDNIQTISIASINFLSPAGQTKLNTNWTDEITGKDSLEGKGVNQPNQQTIQNPNKTDDFYIRQSINSGGKPGPIDNGLLGITQIRVSINTAFNPQIEIELEDVKGRALFESGDQSPYAAFFNFPYPLFQLTIKGFYGKAVRLPLMLNSFKSRYDVNSGNFKISLKFYTYKFTVLSEISLAHLIATPHMYRANFLISQKSQPVGVLAPTTPQFNLNNYIVDNLTVKSNSSVTELGYQKVKELYNEYKSKGLIPNDFPEITLVQMQKRIENFIKNVLDNFTKENLEPLTNCEVYQTELIDFQKKVFYELEKSWFRKYCDPKIFYILNDDKKTKVYPFKKDYLTLEKQQSCITELDSIIKEFNTKLGANKTVGSDGSYKINGKITSSPIELKINGVENLKKPIVGIGDIDQKETLRQRFNTQNNNDVIKIQEEFAEYVIKSTGKPLNSSQVNGYGTDTTPINLFYFEGNGSFLDLTDKMLKDLNVIRGNIENELTEALKLLLESPNNGIGFIPTLKNVLAVIFASGEAFLRLMDDVHKKAWDINSNNGDSLKIRQESILQKTVSDATTDNIQNYDDKLVPIYPWPQFIVNQKDSDGNEKYVIEYPGNKNYINQTKGYLYDVWPEIEFVEEYLRAYTERALPPNDNTAYENEELDIKRVSFNSLEFPQENVIFSNKQEVKYFYEIYERLVLHCYYSKISRGINNPQFTDKIIESFADGESYNIVQSLLGGSPILTQKLKQYGINGSNFLGVLRHISNGGTGESWQNLLRGVFNTTYIKNYVENSEFKIFSLDYLLNLNKNLAELQKPKDLDEFLKNDGSTNLFDFTDTYPFTDKVWCSNNLADGQSITNVFSTSKVIQYNTLIKTITNFEGNGDLQNTKKVKIRPITNFNFFTTFNDNINFNTTQEIITYFDNRSTSPYKQFVTEGNLNYFDYSGGVTYKQTTSIFNTPYFINSIQEGIRSFQSFSTNPFVASAFLFLNSLPLATLREKYKNCNTSDIGTQIQSTTELDYIFATLKKYGAVHKIPYSWVLKIGSIYHRYKKYIETGEDIINTSWSGFSYLNNYDPITSDPQKIYPLVIDGDNIDIVLEKNTPVGSEVSSLMNTGFYPKLINDFNLFYQGVYSINPYLQITGSGYIVDTVFTVTSISSNDLQIGQQINSGSISQGTQITGFITGTGGVGTYSVNISQTSQNGGFNVSNNSTQGYTTQDIQNALDNGLVMKYVDKAIISKIEGFDEKNLTRDLRIIPWTLLSKSVLDSNYWILPSNGSYVNQTLFECFDNVSSTKLKTEVTGNTAVYNGSVRLFWGAPNFGYFDTTKITKPTPLEYIKTIFSGNNQDNFTINGDEKYTKISEIFSVFERNVLDQFEEMFLNFSKSIYDYSDAVLSGETIASQVTYKNFQMLFRSLMKVSDLSTVGQISGLTGEKVIQFVIDQQSKNINSILDGFLNYDILLKIGNPSNYNTKLFKTFSSANPNLNLPTNLLQISDPFILDSFNANTPNALPPLTTLSDSQSNYPQAWKSLQTYVGFSELSGFAYSDSGSYITDFFIDMDISFDEFNVKNFAPIIKIYATQKSLGNVSNKTEFIRKMDEYLQSIEDFQSDILDSLFVKLNTRLPNTTINLEKVNNETLIGDQGNVELWETFKALNDRWIAGLDVSEKTLFEDVLLLDKASRDIGNKVLIDIFKLRDRIMNLPEKASMLSLIQSIIVENNFVIYNLPSYINFYNVNDVSKNPQPKPEGTLEFANSLFGTHLNVDYTNSKSKMLCFYAGKPSEHPDVKNIDYRFRSDVFDLRRSSSNPLLENQINKKDWDKSNKVVGFNVDIGPQNQSIFHGFQVDMQGGTPTAENLASLNQMANQSSNRGTTTQNLSLYNLYKTRSYNCTVSMLGNAMLQPTMYFNLRHVPMFYGPYMILSVNHVITPGQFETVFTGVRQNISELPIPDNYLQALKNSLLKSIQEQIKKDRLGKQQKTIENQKSDLSQRDTALNGLTSPRVNTITTQTCSASTNYAKYQQITNTTTTTITLKDLKTKIINKTKNDKLQKCIFSKIYLSTNSDNNTNPNNILLKTSENNFAAIYLDVTALGNDMNWGSKNTYFNEKYYCNTDLIPYVSFKNVDSCLDFLVNWWSNRMNDITNTNDGNLNIDSIAKFLFLNQTSETADPNIWSKTDPVEIENIKTNINYALLYWNNIN
jgi:hypothetical protein